GPSSALMRGSLNRPTGLEPATTGRKSSRQAMPPLESSSMRSFPIYLLLLLAGMTTAGSMAEESAQAFHRNTIRWMKEGNLAQIAWTVRYSRKEASEAFYQALPQQMANPTAENE